MSERTRRVKIELDGVVGLGELEQARWSSLVARPPSWSVTSSVNGGRVGRRRGGPVRDAVTSQGAVGGAVGLHRRQPARVPPPGIPAQDRRPGSRAPRPRDHQRPILLLDGTGEREGSQDQGRRVALNLAMGLVARSRKAKRVRVEALLDPTVAEGWDAMGELLAPLRPGIVIVHGEKLSTLAATVFPGVAVQRCLFHLARGRVPGGALHRQGQPRARRRLRLPAQGFAHRGLPNA